MRKQNTLSGKASEIGDVKWPSWMMKWLRLPVSGGIERGPGEFGRAAGVVLWLCSSGQRAAGGAS